MRQAALVSDESALEACACSRRCAIQIYNLYLLPLLCLVCGGGGRQIDGVYSGEFPAHGGRVVSAKWERSVSWRSSGPGGRRHWRNSTSAAAASCSLAQATKTTAGTTSSEERTKATTTRGGHRETPGQTAEGSRQKESWERGMMIAFLHAKAATAFSAS